MNDRTCTFEVDVTREDIERFAALSGDYNPLHLDAEYARSTEYGRPIAHGAFLLGFVSRVLGMHLPGQQSLILAIRSRFPKPLFYPSRIRVDGAVRGFDATKGTGVVSVSITDIRASAPVAEAEVNFALHTSGPRTQATHSAAAPEPNLRPSLRPTDGHSRLLITGGTGGVGRRIATALAVDFVPTVLCRSPSPELEVEQRSVDLEDERAVERVLEGLSPSDFYGVIHMSSAPLTRGFLTQSVPDLRRHLRHSLDIPLALARWAVGQDSGVRRFIMFGSTASRHPADPQSAAYSLAKATMEQLGRHLVWDFSLQGGTVNVIAPGFMPVGLNQGTPERARKALIARIPTGRLVEPDDVLKLVRFLLSPDSAQINGTVLTIDGGTFE